MLHGQQMRSWKKRHLYTRGRQTVACRPNPAPMASISKALLEQPRPSTYVLSADRKGGGRRLRPGSHGLKSLGYSLHPLQKARAGPAFTREDRNVEVTPGVVHDSLLATSWAVHPGRVPV